MILYTQDYDSQNYYPAAPIVEITVRSSSKSKKGRRIKALLDSEADATLIPKDILLDINADFLEDGSMTGILDQPVPVTLHAVVIDIGSETLTGIRAIAIPKGSTPILGRDVLNQLIVTLNGLAESVEIQR